MADKEQTGSSWGREEPASKKQLDYIEYRTGAPAPVGLSKRDASEIIERINSGGQGATESQAKPKGKKTPFGCVVVVAILLTSMIWGCWPKELPEPTPQSAPPAPQKAPEKAKSLPEDPPVEKTKAERINEGMKLSEAEAIMGGRGEEVSRETGPDGATTVIYTWTYDDGFLSISAKNGVVLFKSFRPKS